MTTTTEETQIVKIKLTAEERDHLDKIARRYGRMSAGACIRWLIAEKWEKMPRERNYAGSVAAPTYDEMMKAVRDSVNKAAEVMFERDDK